MSSCTMLPSALLIAALLLQPVLRAQQSTGASALTAEDRAGIEALLGRYLLALGSCDGERYAALFAPDGGYFASASRGRVEGHHRLIEMLKSYDCNYVNDVAPPHAPNPQTPYKIALEPAPGGATGIAYLNGSRYEDEYIKTTHGWLFKSRTVITNKEHNAHLTTKDFEAIQKVAMQKGGPYIDFYEKRPDGTSRFKSAGVSLAVAADGVTGKAYLKDGSHYEDVYVRGAQGWDIKSRTLIPAVK